MDRSRIWGGIDTEIFPNRGQGIPEIQSNKTLYCQFYQFLERTAFKQNVIEPINALKFPRHESFQMTSRVFIDDSETSLSDGEGKIT